MNITEDLDLLVDAFLLSANRADMKRFVQAIMTPKEIQTMATRLEIIKRLKHGISHHQIALDLGVGVATVTRGSKELQLGRFQNV